jgi:hypothetical protein
MDGEMLGLAVGKTSVFVTGFHHDFTIVFLTAGGGAN